MRIVTKSSAGRRRGPSRVREPVRAWGVDEAGWYVESSALVAALLERDAGVLARLAAPERCITSALTFAETRRVDNLSGGLCKSTDLDAVHERLVPFCVGGFKALCERPRKKAQRRHASKA